MSRTLLRIALPLLLPAAVLLASQDAAAVEARENASANVATVEHASAEERVSLPE